MCFGFSKFTESLFNRLGTNLLIRFVLIMLSFLTIVLSIRVSMDPQESNLMRFVAVPLASLIIQFVLVLFLFKFKDSMSPPKQSREIAVCKFNSEES